MNLKREDRELIVIALRIAAAAWDDDADAYDLTAPEQAHDRRVDADHARKLAAALEAES